MLAVIGSILLGIVVIMGLIGSKEMNGCFGIFLVIILFILLAAIALGALVFMTGW